MHQQFLKLVLSAGLHEKNKDKITGTGRVVVDHFSER